MILEMERVTNGWFGSLGLRRMWGEDTTTMGEAVSITVECVTGLEMKMICLLNSISIGLAGGLKTKWSSITETEIDYSWK